MSYLKLKMQADQAIALSIERSLVQLKKDTTSIVQSVRSGTERASWYGSFCLMTTKTYAGS